MWKSQHKPILTTEDTSQKVNTDSGLPSLDCILNTFVYMHNHSLWISLPVNHTKSWHRCFPERKCWLAGICSNTACLSSMGPVWWWRVWDHAVLKFLVFNSHLQPSHQTQIKVMWQNEGFSTLLCLKNGFSFTTNFQKMQK